MRLWRDSIEAVFDPRPAVRSASAAAKVRLLAGDVIAHAAVPRRLAAVCELEEVDDRASIEPMRRSLAAGALTRHAAVLDFEERRTLDHHFAAVGRVAEEVPCFRLRVPHRYEEAAATIETVLRGSATQ